MTREKNKDPEDAELERDARSHRRFSLAEAIGRAGSDLLKGASPVTRRRQAELLVERFLERNLEDAEGALQIVLSRRLGNSEALLENRYDDPLGVLAGIAEGLLGSEPALREFVHAVDAEWGRIYLERPHFERQGQAPDLDDPYTLSSTRLALTDLLSKLRDP